MSKPNNEKYYLVFDKHLMENDDYIYNNIKDVNKSIWPNYKKYEDEVPRIVQIILYY